MLYSEKYWNTTGECKVIWKEGRNCRSSQLNEKLTITESIALVRSDTSITNIDSLQCDSCFLSDYRGCDIALNVACLQWSDEWKPHQKLNWSLEFDYGHPLKRIPISLVPSKPTFGHQCWGQKLSKAIFSCFNIGLCKKNFI